MQYSFKLDLAEKRRIAKVKVCESKAEHLFRSFANLIDGCYSPKEIISSREVSILINRKDGTQPITVTISSEAITKENTLIEFTETFTELSINEVTSIFKDAIEKDGTKYDYYDNFSDDKDEDSNSKENEISDSEEETELFARIIFRI